MKKGFKLIDGSIWTIISFDVIEGYADCLPSDIPLSAIIEVTGVKYDEDLDHTHPFNANFSDCRFEDFKVSDPRIVSITANVFEYID